jgi:hypothetical protein
MNENQRNLWYLNKALRELNPNAEYQATDIEYIKLDEWNYSNTKKKI